MPRVSRSQLWNKPVTDRTVEISGAKAAKAGAATNRENADRFAANTLPIIRGQWNRVIAQGRLRAHRARGAERMPFEAAQLAASTRTRSQA
jgi:hypothetical protein